MKFSISLLSVFCISVSSALAAGDTRTRANEDINLKDGYQMVWNDEFDGDHLNTEAWNIEINGNGNGNAELQ